MSLSDLTAKNNLLYRFEPSCENRIETLAENKLWISDSATFNDPFDMNLIIRDQSQIGGFDEAKYKAAAKLFFDDYNPAQGHWMFNEDIVEKIRNWYQGLPLSGLDYIEQSVVRHMATFGVQCFSSNWNIPVSWAHYANKHTGFCIEYEVNSWELA